MNRAEESYALGWGAGFDAHEVMWFLQSGVFVWGAGALCTADAGLQEQGQAAAGGQWPPRGTQPHDAGASSPSTASARGPRL